MQKENIYLDWQRNAHLLGEAKLLKKLKDGRTFILEDIQEDGTPIPENKQVVYTYETWWVSFLTLTDLGERYVANPEFYVANIRKLYMVGISTATDQKDEWSWHGRQDKFIEINGKEIY